MKFKKKESQKKKTIMCFIEHYLPGHKSGGPVRTIANFVEYFGDKYEILIICSDRDYLDTKPYPRKNFHKWHKIGKAKVFYVEKKLIDFVTILKILRSHSYNLLYLNGLFSYKFTILPLLFRKMNLVPNDIPCVIAPRGMLSINATKLKPSKKIAFLFFASIVGLFKDLIFQASNSLEKSDIRRVFNNINKKIFIAPNLTTVSPINYRKVKLKKKGSLKLVFLSRISPMKNLDFLLRSLTKVNNSVELAIYGNKENEDYYKICHDLKKNLPKNINVTVKKHIKNELVQKTLSQYDLFVLPTKGENFGHVILESLSAGTPVLVSNKVFWKSDKHGGIQKLPLKENKWAEEITNWSNYSKKILANKKIAALNVAYNYNKDNKSLVLNRELLDYVFKSTGKYRF